jgi:hypothetical protein
VLTSAERVQQEIAWSMTQAACDAFKALNVEYEALWSAGMKSQFTTKIG